MEKTNQLLRDIDKHMRAEWYAGRLPAESWPKSLSDRLAAAVASKPWPMYEDSDGAIRAVDPDDLKEAPALAATPAADAPAWDGKLPEQLQRCLNTLRMECKSDAVNDLEFEVRSVFSGMHTSLTTVKRMYHAAQKRLDSVDAAQPDPFANPAAAAPVVLPEPVGWRHSRTLTLHETEQEVQLADGDSHAQPLFTEQQLRALLATATGLPAQAVEKSATHGMNLGQRILHVGGRENAQTYIEFGSVVAVRALVDQVLRDLPDGAPGFVLPAPQAQAVERGEVLVTVSGFTGSGKSAIAGEIEILCRALGLQVDWPGGDSEKNMTHADWTGALEQYKPRVRIVEHNVPTSESKNDH